MESTGKTYDDITLLSDQADIIEKSHCLLLTCISGSSLQVMIAEIICHISLMTIIWLFGSSLDRFTVFYDLSPLVRNICKYGIVNLSPINFERYVY